MRNTKWALIALTVVGMVATVPTQARAAAITFDLVTVFSGSTPSGSPTVTLTDVAGGVEVKIDAGTLTGTEFLDDIYLNFMADPLSLTALYQSGVEANSFNTGVNSFKADGDGYFDIMFDFPPPPGGSATFGAGESSVYLLTMAGISTSLFNQSSFCETGCGTGSYFAAAHIQGITGGLSAWVGDPNGPGGPPPPPPPPTPVPEPASMLLFGSGLLGMAARMRSRKKAAAVAQAEAVATGVSQ